MRYQILTKIEAEDHLAKLFNAYQRQLSTLEQVVLPRESMANYQRLLHSATSTTPSEEAAQVFTFTVPRFYYLQVLNNSLTDLHKNVGWAIQHLTTFFDQYQGDVQRYAIEKRVAAIDEFGSDDESDWQEDGVDEEGPKWKVTDKDDAESLKSYTLHADLQPYFAGDDSRGERIGTSGAEDFAYFSDQVQRATEFNPFKLLRAVTGAALPVYRQNEAGELVAQSLGEEVESDLNEDLRNESIVRSFHQVLQAGAEAATTFATATAAEHYQRLLTQLKAIRDVHFGC